MKIWDWVGNCVGTDMRRSGYSSHSLRRSIWEIDRLLNNTIVFHLQKLSALLSTISLFSAFFGTFEWAVSAGGQDGVNSGELPEGTGEFLDTWLFLLERLVNPRTMLDSPNSLPAKSSTPGYQPFSPLKFLIHIQKVIFFHSSTKL